MAYQEPSKRFWATLLRPNLAQIQETVTCALQDERQFRTIWIAFEAYVHKLREGILLGLLTYDKRQTALLNFLRLWPTWTDFLPYALQACLPGLNYTWDVNRTLKQDSDSAFSSNTMLLHCAICIFHNYSGIPSSPFALESCGDIVSKPSLLSLTEDRTNLGLMLDVAICHELHFVVHKHIPSVPGEARQILLDTVFERCMEATIFNERHLTLKQLADLGGQIRSHHLCYFFLTDSESRSTQAVELLEEYLHRARLIAHHQRCQCSKSQQTASKSSFLRHWAWWWTPATAEGKDQARRMLQLLLECGEQVNDSHPEEGALLHVLLDPTHAPTWPRNRMTKVIAALQAGADPDVEGPHGSVLKTAMALHEACDRSHMTIRTDLRRGKWWEETRKIVELLKHVTDHEGKLPDDLDHYASFSCS